MIINSYIDVQDAVATPANTWFFSNSTNSGNNTGIAFVNYSGVRVSNVNVQDCIATPAFWFAEGASVNSGNNTGWIFSPVVTNANSQFMMFF